MSTKFLRALEEETVQETSQFAKTVNDIIYGIAIMLGVVSFLLCLYGMVVMLNKIAKIKRVRPDLKKNKLSIETE